MALAAVATVLSSVAVGVVALPARPASAETVTRATVDGTGVYDVPVENGFRLSTKTVGSQFYVRKPLANGTAGDFEPLGFIVGINIGASKPFFDPGDVPASYDDWMRVRATSPVRRRPRAAD